MVTMGDGMVMMWSQWVAVVLAWVVVMLAVMGSGSFSRAKFWVPTSYRPFTIGGCLGD